MSLEPLCKATITERMTTRNHVWFVHWFHTYLASDEVSKIFKSPFEAFGQAA